MVARTTENWNEIVGELKAWMVFAQDLKVVSIAAV
jgi:hypothetical protein